MTIKWIKSRVLVPLILAIGFSIISYILIASPPESQRRSAEYVVPTVKVVTLEEGSFDLTIQAQGLVKSVHQDIKLIPQVSGRIINFHPNFRPGGIILAGETIIQIDTLDYTLALKEADAFLASAEASVMIEEGLQLVAKAEFELGEGDINLDASRRAHALRVPQLKKVHAEKKLAQINHDKAMLALERTALTLPFDTVVLETLSEIGEIIFSGNTLAMFTRTDSVWVELRIQQKHLNRLKIKSAHQAGSKVTFKSNGYSYQGEVISVRSNLTASTRMGGVIVEVTNSAMSNNQSASSVPRLRLGSHIEATLQAGTMNSVLKIPRKALTDNSQVYVVDGDDNLQLRDIKVVWLMPDSLIIQSDLQSQDRLIVNRIAGIAPGSKVNSQVSMN